MDRYLSAQGTGYKLSYTSACVAGGGGVAACNTSWNSLVNLGHQELDSLKVGSFKFSNVDDLYYKTTSNLPINIVGMTFGLSGVNFPLTFKYSRPDTVLRFPLAYNNQDSCLSSYAIDLTSLGINFVYKVSAKRVNTVEGWGSLTTPYKSYASTLKLKTLIYSYDTLFYNSSTIPVPATTSVTYSWFEASNQRSVLQVDGNVTANGIAYSNIEYLDTIRCLTPRAQFTPDPLVPYLDQSTGTASVSFNNSSDNSNLYSWNFGDSAGGTLDTSHVANPSHTYTGSGVYSVTLIACNGVCSPLRCDTFTEPLSIFDSTNTQSSYTYTPLEPCIGDTVKFANTSLNANSYKWNLGDNTTSVLKNPKKAYTASGTYVVQLIAIGSVKSDTSYQSVIVSTAPVATISPSGNISICSTDSVILTGSGGDYYQWSNGRVSTSITVKASGTYTVTAYNNCGNAASAPVVVTVTSGIVPTIAITDSPTNVLCPGSAVSFRAAVTNGGSTPTYQWKKNGVNVSSSITYSYSGFSNGDSVWCILTSNAGCGGTTTVSSNVIKVTVKANSVSSVSQSICQGSSYSFGGVNLTLAGTYRDTLTSSNGCDSIITLTLTVKPNSASARSQSICQGSSYSFGGVNLTSAGTYRDSLTSSNGCDSIITLTLVVKPNSASSRSQSICQGSSYSFGGVNLTSAGTYRDTLTSSNGCDSIITLTLTVKPNSASSRSQSICQGSSYSFNGVALTTAGTYRDTLTSSNGCDSIITLTLTVKPNSASSRSQSICQGSSYSFNGVALTTAGTYRDTLTSSNGCDSMITLTLTVKPNSASSISQSICQGSSYSFGGVNLTSAGTYRDTLTSSNGCDSIITLTLTVKSILRVNDTVSLCNGSSYLFNGVNLTTAGTYRDTLTGANGCDSITMLNLSFHSFASSSFSASICPGSSYLFSGSHLTVAGTYTDTLTAAAGCDSIVTLHLTVGTNSYHSIADTICQGSRFLFNGVSISAAGTYTDTLSSAAGCDSIVTLTVVVRPNSASSLSQSICPGSSYMFHGASLSVAGTYRDTLASASGCDSVITLTLSVKPNSTGSVSQYICQGSSYSFHGVSLTTAGIYRDTLNAANGCDSIVTLTLTVSPNTSSTITATACTGSSYLFHGVGLTVSGTYTDTLSSANGCDSVVTLHLTFSSFTTGAVSGFICPGSSYLFNGQSLNATGIYIDTLTGTGGCDSIATLTLTVGAVHSTLITYGICPGSSYSFGGVALTAAGAYRDTLTAVTGCDSIVTLDLNINAKPNPVITQAGTDTLHTGIYTSYQWLKSGIGITGAVSSSIVVSQNGNYQVLVSDSNGCRDTSVVFAFVNTGLATITDDHISLYPNPNNGSFILESQNDVGKYIVISDMVGRVISESMIASGRQPIEMSDISGGAYVLSIKGTSDVIRFTVTP
jgi:hypothetical protein